MLIKKSLLLLGFLLVLGGCDFTPRVYKKIISTQEYLLNQEYSKAAHEFEKIIKNNPNNEIKTKIFFQLGELYSVNLNNNKKAIYFYKQLIDLDFDPAWVIKARERISEISFMHLKNYRQSFQYYQKLVQHIPKLNKHDYYQYQMYLSLYNLNKLDEAINGFKKIVKNNTHQYQTQAYYSLGQGYFHKERWNESIKNLKEYIKREKRNDKIALAKFLIANAYETKEELKKAYNLYYSILGDYPNTQIIQNKLNSIYNRRVARKR